MTAPSSHGPAGDFSGTQLASYISSFRPGSKDAATVHEKSSQQEGHLGGEVPCGTFPPILEQSETTYLAASNSPPSQPALSPNRRASEVALEMLRSTCLEQGLSAVARLACSHSRNQAVIFGGPGSCEDLGTEPLPCAPQSGASNPGMSCHCSAHLRSCCRQGFGRHPRSSHNPVAALQTASL